MSTLRQVQKVGCSTPSIKRGKISVIIEQDPAHQLLLYWKLQAASFRSEIGVDRLTEFRPRNTDAWILVLVISANQGIWLSRLENDEAAAQTMELLTSY